MSDPATPQKPTFLKNLYRVLPAYPADQLPRTEDFRGLSLKHCINLEYANIVTLSRFHYGAF